MARQPRPAVMPPPRIGPKDYYPGNVTRISLMKINVSSQDQAKALDNTLPSTKFED